MPVIQPGQPSVAIQLPVPTPVQSKPKQGSLPQRAKQPRQSASPVIQPGQPVPVPKLPPRLNAVILPWGQSKQRMSRRLQAKKIYYARNRVGITYEDAERFLGRRDQRRLASNKILHRTNDGNIHVRLHNTDVVTYHPDGGITINTGGYRTRTTAATIKDYTGKGVSFVGGNFWFDGHNIEGDTHYIPSPKNRDTEYQSFHKLFHEQDRDETNHSPIYADYIEERHNKPEHASIIRHDAVDARHLGNMSPYITRTDMIEHLKPGEFGVLRDSSTFQNNAPSLSLLQRSLHDPRHVLWWVKPYKSTQEREQALKQVVNQEGAKHLASEDSDTHNI